MIYLGNETNAENRQQRLFILQKTVNTNEAAFVVEEKKICRKLSLSVESWFGDFPKLVHFQRSRSHNSHLFVGGGGI